MSLQDRLQSSLYLRTECSKRLCAQDVAPNAAIYEFGDHGSLLLTANYQVCTHLHQVLILRVGSG